MKLFTSIDQSFSQIALSDSVGVIAFSDNGVVHVNRYTGADVETLFQFPASPSALALSPNYEYCAYTVADQTFVRELTTNTETVHACKGQIRVNNSGDLLATDPIYFNEPLDVTLHGNLYCTFTDNGYVFASEREIYDGDSTATTNETIVGLWQKFFVTASGRFFNFSGINIQDTGMEVSHVFDYGNFAGLHVGDSLYVTDGYLFPEKVQTVPLNVPEKISSYVLPASVNSLGAGAYRIEGKGVGAPTCISPGVYLHARQTDTLELYVGSKNINSQKFYSAAELDGIIGQFAFDRSDKNEITGQAVELIGNTRIVDGVLRKANGHDSRFNLGVYDFTNTDFTVEFSTCIYAIDPTQTYCMLLGQSVDVGGGYANNSWDVTIFLSNGNLRLLANIYNGTTRSEMVSPQVIEFGKTYHVVFEKVGAVANFYLDSVLIGSLPWASMRIPEDKRLCSWYKNAANTRSFGAFDVSNIRVAKKRLYPTTVSRPRVLPLLPSFEYSTTDYDSFKDFKSIYVVGAENTTQHSISFEQYFDSIKIVSDASLPGLAENPELLKGIVFSTNSYGPPVDDPYTVRQFRFENNSIVDEVTGGELIMAGTAKVENNKLVTDPPAYTNYAGHPNVLFDEDEDFYIRISVNMPFSDTRNNPILSVWNSGVVGLIAWSLSRLGSATSTKLRFSFKPAVGGTVNITSESTLAPDTDYTIELSRKDGTIYMFVDGALEGSVVTNAGNPKIGLPIMRTDVLHNPGDAGTLFGGGKKWDIQIRKGISGPIASHAVEPLEEYVRPVYSEEDANAIVLQTGYRRGSPMCEKFDTVMQMFGTATISKQARLTQTNATSSYAQIALPYFGSGDFTVEFMCNISAVSANGVRIGHWTTAGGGADAIWGMLINSARRISFVIARTATANDWIDIRSADGVFPLNQDVHIVVERVGHACTLYVNAVAVAQGDIDLPIRTVSSFRTTGFSGTDSCAGQFWNIRIADKALYNGSIEQLPAFPALPYYVPDVASNIAAQYRFKDAVAKNEVNGTNLSYNAGTTIHDGYITTTRDTGIFSIPCAYFGAADFTVEAKVTFLEWGLTGGNYILGQHLDGTQVSNRNSWNLRVVIGINNVYVLQWVERRDNTTIATSTRDLPAIELNTEYHFVAERVGSLLTLYVNGAVYTTLSTNLPLTQSPDNVRSQEWQDNPWGACARIYKDIRIASRALYRGRINNNFKSIQPL